MLHTHRQVTDNCGWVDVKAVLGGQIGDDPVVMLEVVAPRTRPRMIFSVTVCACTSAKCCWIMAIPKLHGVFGRVDDLFLAVHENLAFIGPIEAIEHLHDRALAGAVFAQQRKHLALAYLYRYILIGDDLGKVLADIS